MCTPAVEEEDYECTVVHRRYSPNFHKVDLGWPAKFRETKFLEMFREIFITHFAKFSNDFREISRNEIYEYFAKFRESDLTKLYRNEFCLLFTTKFF
jgi:hypothetical protein